MAYADERATRPSPASITGAVAINALMVAGVIFAAPEILPQDPWKILTTYGVATPPPPPKPVEQIEKPVKSPSARPYAPPKPDAPQPPPGETLIPQPGAGLTPPPGAGGGIVEQPPQPQPHIPVLTGARVNPRYADALQPAYPPGMIREGREGVVIVRVLIGADGRVKALEPVSSDGEAFLAATRKQALGKWRFLPATRDGEAVEAWREMTVRFRLPD